MSKYGQIVKTDTELKPCPFCGGKGVLVRIDHKYFVTCDTCTCRVASGYIGVRYYGEAEEEAIEAWNTRIGDESSSTVEQVREKLNKLIIELDRLEYTLDSLTSDMTLGEYEQERVNLIDRFAQGIVNEMDTQAERTCRDTGENEWHFVCSACSYEQNGYECWNYCPNCGAKVVN